ncbi:TPA: hypothetical protein ACTUXY_003071 [Legionella pneumophila]
MTHAEEFAQRLHPLLRACHPSKAQAIAWLAHTCDCTVQMARRYWKGTALPKPATVRQLAENLQVRASWLYFGEGQPQVDSDTLHIHPEVLAYLLHTLLPALVAQKTGDAWVNPLCTLLMNLPLETPECLPVLHALIPLI